MRLTKLKIAGFKSFVEPTTVLFPGQLAGVVGPNGCGKSNIIDAVRWVLGESKASELRGESIQDVIFKGAGNRQPVSRASVELFFDNALGRAAGQWSQYTEITVKRVLDREGNSSYYINNLHVRRRDVIDLFLGTGLGPRAYAIIGQGMISRIVEAKPDELRFFLEEAAGVTKYKERRKETEHRLEDARENLARVEDICNELGAQVTRLQAQAEVARSYRELQARLSHQQTLLWLKKRNAARDEAQTLTRQVEEAVNRIEAATAQLREVEARVEQAREAHFAASDTLHAAQGEMYAANGEVSRLEAELTHLREARVRLQTRLGQLDADERQWREESLRLAADETRWQALLDNARERATVAAERHAEASNRLPALEAALAEAGREVVDLRRELNDAEQALRLAEADQGHARRALEGGAQRSARLTQDRAALDEPDAALLSVARAREEAASAALAETREHLAATQAAVPETEARLRQARDALQAAHRRLAETRARHEALTQLQAKVAQRGDLDAWLRTRGLADAQPLWRTIRVDAGWETAVEAVLRERFAALAADADTVRAALAEPPPALMSLAVTDGAPAGNHTAAPDALRAKVHCADPRWSAVLDEWLAGVSAVDDLAARVPLSAGRCVSPAGHLLTPAGLTLYVPDAKTHGVIERQREIDELAAQLTARATDEAVAQAAQQEAEQQLAALHEQLAQARRAAQETQQSLHAAQVETLKLTQARERFNERSAQLDRELAEVARQQAGEQERLAAAEAQAEIQRARGEELRSRLEQAQEIQRQKETALRDARQVEAQLAREAQETNFSARECQSKLEDNARALATATQQLARIAAETETARAELAVGDDEVLQVQLNGALDLRRLKESALAERRDALEAAAAELRELEEQRLRLEQEIAPLRERINELRLKAQAAELNATQFQERLSEANVLSEADEAPFAEALAANPKDSVLQGEISRINAGIEALGPVNLAALDELATAVERKGFLDAQSADLNAAIGTLEDAIRRIDRDTREQLRETYDTVNRQLGILFPQLFGGGEAKLTLTGEEILDAGIQIIAQPPGKKNSTIHMLSGGEKALTAIALVFAMFQLNPAPFCMLDEVDAPLDDSNTVRFCDLVKRMSTQTQFIFISHNKIAMEMAQQLIGVTMQEQGVSRVVEVDIGEALRLADEQRVA